jgi:hypothetical protein
VELDGPHQRPVVGAQGNTMRLRHSSVACPTCEVGFFPLGEALALLPGQPTPRLPESLVWLGTWRPLAQDPEA